MKLFIGVDVSKNTLDICCNGKAVCVPNNTQGLNKFYSLLKQEIKAGNEVALVVCEPTGGYETKLVEFIVGKNMPMCVAHANKVRNFAKSKGLLAKTDKIDACLLAEYGEVTKAQPTAKLPSAENKMLAELLKRREQLKTDKTRETVRLDKNLRLEIKNSIRSHIKWLEKEIRVIEDEIKTLQKEHESINTKVELLKSVPSVGNITACSLVAFLPELGSSTEAKKITSLVGLVPFVKDSGTYKGRRFIQGGRANLRKIIYMAALSSIRHYKEMREFYLRLRNKGKTAKVALIAVARKLLTVLNSVMWRQTLWQETCPTYNTRT